MAICTATTREQHYKRALLRTDCTQATYCSSCIRNHISATNRYRKLRSMSAATTQTEKKIIMPAAVARAEEEEMSAASAQVVDACASGNEREHPMCTLSDDQKTLIEENMELLKSKLELQDVGILLFQK